MRLYDTCADYLQPCLDPPKSKWHNGQSRFLNQTFIKRRGYVLGKIRGRRVLLISPGCLKLPILDILIGQIESNYLIGQDCVSLNA